MSFDLECEVSLLARTPAVIDGLVRGLPGDWLHANYGPGTWSVHQIIGHLIHGEQTDWIPRARWILEKGESIPFEPFDRNGHAGLCAEKTTDQLLEMFGTLRAQQIAELRSLPLDDGSLARRGRHPALGPVTLGELLSTWVAHDLNHVAQICKALAFQQAPRVGPWRAYLSILAPPAPR